MRKLLCVCVLALGLITINQNTVIAQSNFGVEAGLNMANVTGTEFQTDARTAFMAGVFYRYWLNTTLALQGELLYSQKGWKEDEYSYKLNYVMINLLLSYYFASQASFHPFIQAGPYFGILANAKGEYDGESYDLDGVNGLDIGLLIKAGILLTQLEVGLRLAKGFTSITDSNYEGGYSPGGPNYEEGPTVTNLVFGIYLGYHF